MKTPAPASSSGSPKRPAGVRATMRSCIAPLVATPVVISVVIQPGKITFTWIPSDAHAAASDFVSWTTPPLLAAYGMARSLPKSEYMEPMLTPCLRHPP